MSKIIIKLLCSLFPRCQTIWQLHAQSADKPAAIKLEDDPLNSGPSYEHMCSPTGFVGRAPVGERTRGCMSTAAVCSSSEPSYRDEIRVSDFEVNLFIIYFKVLLL